jgi:hypothetical protein
MNELKTSDSPETETSHCLAASLYFVGIRRGLAARLRMISSDILYNNCKHGQIDDVINFPLQWSEVTTQNLKYIFLFFTV